MDLFDFCNMERERQRKRPVVPLYVECPLMHPLSVALDVARGMEYLHSKGLIHRDINSFNVLLDSQFRGKINNFRAAKICGVGGADRKITSKAYFETYRGSCVWSAPEILLRQPYSEKMDVYSFAIVLWELVTFNVPGLGARTRRAGSREQGLELVVEQGLRPPQPRLRRPCSRDGRSVEGAVFALMEDCWQLDADARLDFSTICARLEPLASTSRTDPELHFPWALFDTDRAERAATTAAKAVLREKPAAARRAIARSPRHPPRPRFRDDAAAAEAPDTETQQHSSREPAASESAMEWRIDQ
jgi:serine/threonine protein kinase